MEITNNNRFTVHKNGLEYIKSLSEKELKAKKIDNIDICSSKDFEYKYNWDTEFKKFFSWNFAKVDEIIKYYPDTEIFLKNIYWDKIVSNLEKVVESIFSWAIWKIKEKSLVIINMNPIEMVFFWETLKSCWINNISYDLIRQPAINSYSKTFEALLLMVAFEKSKYFKDIASSLAKKIEDLTSKIKKEDLYMIMSENNTYHRYNFHNISNYLKTQLWMADDKITYRIDKYPESDFLNAKWIKNIIILDSDDDKWKSIEFYISNIETEIPWLKVINEKYELSEISQIWHYEDYLIEKNIEYTAYRANIERVAANKARLSENASNAKAKNADPYVARKKTTILNENNNKLLPFLILFPIIFIAFLSSDLNWWTYVKSWSWTTYRSWWSSFFYYNLGSSSSSLGSSSTKSSSSSFIKSFGWGGFSKWFS